MLGNAAAAQDAAVHVPKTVVSSDPAEVSLPGHTSLVGTYALPGGPAVALRTNFTPGLLPEPNPIRILLAPLETDAPAQITLDYSVTPERKRLWRDGVLIADRPFEARELGDEMNTVLEIIRHLVSDRPLMSVLHGSGVRWRGKNLIFMGISGSGKSTLAALLAADGGAYLGDDSVALLHPGFGIRPLPLSPSIKKQSWPIVMPHFPQLGDAPILHKGSLPYRYLHGAPVCPDPDAGSADLLVFSHFSSEKPAKFVRLTPIETVLNMSRCGLWLSPDHAEGLIDWTLGVKSIALRQTPDLDKTKQMLLAAIADDSPVTL